MHMRQQGNGRVGTLIPMHNLSDPAAWDALQASRNWAHLLSQLPNDPSPVTLARRAQLYMQSDDPIVNDQALTLLDQAAECPPCTGIRLVVLCQFGHHERVLAEGYNHHGMTPLEREDACHAHTALSVSCAMRGRSLESYAHIRIALDHARALGMHDRAQFLEVQHLSTLTLAGQPHPEEYQKLLVSSMPPMRRSLGLRGHAEALMATGDYRGALRALGAPTMDDGPTAGLRAALSLVLGMPVLKQPEPKTNWEKAALGIGRFLEGSNDIGDLLTLTTEPSATVGRIMAGLMLCRGERYDKRALRILGEEPVRADQRAAWRLARWIIDHMSGRTDRAGYHIRAVESAMAGLRCPQALLGLLARVAPQLYVLLCHSPAQIQGLGEFLPSIPILTGDVILHGGRRIPVPGRSGRMMVLDAMGLPSEELDPTEKRRFKQRLKEEGLSEPVNLGWVVLASHAESGEPEWANALQDTMSQLTPAVLEELSHHPL